MKRVVGMVATRGVSCALLRELVRPEPSPILVPTLPRAPSSLPLLLSRSLSSSVVGIAALYGPVHFCLPHPYCF